MEPRIQYARTSDGVSIAFWSMGEGVPAIEMPPIPWSHLQMEWRDPGYRSWFEALLSGKQLVRYDSRGSGLSDHDISSYDLDSFALDIDAVADKLGLGQFVLVCVSIGSPAGIAYAASRSERVSKLVLWCPVSRSADISIPQGDVLKGLREADWEMFVQTAAHAMVAGWEAGEAARQFAAIMRESVEASSPLARDVLSWEVDTTEALGEIRCPTLILHRRELVLPPLNAARYIAARIPNADLVVLEGGAILPWVGDMESAARVIDEFLGTAGAPRPEPKREEVETPKGLATILFTDIEGSTTRTQRLGDATAQEVLRTHNSIVRQALKAHSGTEIKHTGDGIMASFPLPSSAVESAIDIQRGVADHSDRDPTSGFRVRIGLNAGEPVVEERDLFGTAVQLASRICTSGEGGQVLVSDVVRQLVAGKGFLFADRGQSALRGFEDPVRLFEVRWREERP